MDFTSKPILSSGFLKWIKNNDFSNKIILEIGAGNSTYFFSKYFKKVYSYDNFKDWVDKIKSLNLSNVDVQLFTQNIFNNEEFKSKVNNSDVIFIDNNPQYVSRLKFASFAHQNKKDEAIIILDNGEGNIGAYEFLRSRYYCADYLRSTIEENNNLTQTTIFYKPRHKKGMNKERLYMEVGYIQELIEDGHINEAKIRIENLRQDIQNQIN